MPVINSIAAMEQDMRQWRQALHRMPELGFGLPRTSAFVADRLRDFGVDEIHEGIAQHGIVAVIDGRGVGPTIGLRADMDALPIHEETGAAYASETPGQMHACGHDGHTAMLLGAAKDLARTRNFTGRVALIFQPAEEDGGGGDVMVREGVMERFDIARVFAIHNAPGLEEGSFVTTPGPIMAAVDTWHVDVIGVGGHAAMPHETRDPIPCAVAIAAAMPTIVSRNNRAQDDLVISVTQIHAGSADNIIPGTAYLMGTVRSFDDGMRDMVEARMAEIVAGTASAYGVEATLRYDRFYPATVNDAVETEFAVRVAQEVVGADRVDAETPRQMGAEDFSYMLNARPGAYLCLGAGEGAGLHHPKFDFNDRIAPIGASFFARLVETAQPVANP